MAQRHGITIPLALKTIMLLKSWTESLVKKIPDSWKMVPWRNPEMSRYRVKIKLYSNVEILSHVTNYLTKELVFLRIEVRI